MKARLVLLVIVAALLFLGGSVLAQAGGPAAPASNYFEPGIAAGGNYRLAGLSWEVRGTPGGAGYLLWGPAAPRQGGGCCCVYLPCTMRHE